jgi:hypothetical protein
MFEHGASLASNALASSRSSSRCYPQQFAVVAVAQQQDRLIWRLDDIADPFPHLDALVTCDLIGVNTQNN